MMRVCFLFCDAVSPRVIRFPLQVGEYSFLSLVVSVTICSGFVVIAGKPLVGAAFTPPASSHESLGRFYNRRSCICR